MFTLRGSRLDTIIAIHIALLSIKVNVTTMDIGAEKIRVPFLYDIFSLYHDVNSFNSWDSPRGSEGIRAGGGGLRNLYIFIVPYSFGDVLDDGLVNLQGLHGPVVLEGVQVPFHDAGLELDQLFA